MRRKQGVLVWRIEEDAVVLDPEDVCVGSRIAEDRQGSESGLVPMSRRVNRNRCVICSGPMKFLSSLVILSLARARTHVRSYPLENSDV